MNGTKQGNAKAETIATVSVIIWRDYLIQRRRSLRTELAEIESILQHIAEQGVDKAPISTYTERNS